MARRASPTNQAIKSADQSEKQLVLPSRRKSSTGKSKLKSELRKKSGSSEKEIQRLQEQLAQRDAELAVINSIQSALASKLDFQGIIDAVGDKLSEIFEDGNVGIGFVDELRNVMTFPYVVENGNRLDYFEIGLDTPSVLAHTIKRRRPLIINRNISKRFGTEVFNSSSLDQRELKAWLSIPLMSGDKILGGVALRNWKREDAYTESDVRLLQTVANGMIVALENARLFDETQRLLKETEQRATELQIINNIGQTLTEVVDLDSMIQRVGERIQEALRVKNIVISVFDEKTSHVLSSYMVRNGKQIKLTEENIDLKRFKLAIRASARAGGRSWVVNKVAEKTWQKWWRFVVDEDIPKSFVTLPLLAGREVIGGITIADYEKENAFSDLSVNLLETIASNMGTAIQNVRLFEETQRLLNETEQRATELQIINNIGQTLTEGGDLDSMIQRVGERIQEALNVNNIAISIFDKETGHVIAPYMVRNGEQIILTEENFDLRRYKTMIRASIRGGGVSWVVKGGEVEKVWRRSWRGPIADDVPKSTVVLPLLAGKEIIGGISLAAFDREDAFTDLSIKLLETIASNMGTAIQNVRLFEETQRLFKEAEEARASAERANKAKSTFLANMSHELRTPLNAIIGFTRIVKRKAEGVLPEKQIENLDKVLVSSEHLLGLINTVLDIAKIEAGRMDVIPSKFSLSALIDQCATLATPLLKPNVVLEKQVDETLGFMFSDPDKVKQIVLNLLSNAAKFTNEGQIILAVDKIATYTGIQGNSSAESPAYLSPCVRVSVIDSGIGISEEALDRVFDEFQQADNTTTREYGGTGLGLTISRNLARLLGGDLTATSELGKGSTFTLTLPIEYGKKLASSPDLKIDSVKPAESMEGGDSVQYKVNASGPHMKTILIVEDTDLNVQLLTQLLDNDYKLLVAKDGLQGVSTAQRENPDLILMDISLPVIDGYEATRRIRLTMTSTPIIGLSAHAMSGDAEKAKEAGCNDYLTKPVDEALLIQKLNQYLR